MCNNRITIYSLMLLTILIFSTIQCIAVENIVDGLPKAPKSVVLTNTTDISDQIKEKYTVYVIKEVFNLDDDVVVNIPEGCVLKFEGGSINHGTIHLKGTILEGQVKINCRLFGNCSNDYILPEWFYDGKGDYTEAIQRAVNVGAGKIIKFTGDSYKVHGAVDSADNAITLISGTTLLSTVKSRIYTDSSPYGWLVKLKSSSSNPANNIIIDGLFFDQSNLHQNKSIPDNSRLYLIEWGYLNTCLIRNCKFVYCARNCVKISGVRTKNITIESNEFEYLQGVWKTNDNTSLYLRGIDLKVKKNVFRPSVLNNKTSSSNNYRFATAVELHGPINECSNNTFEGMNTCIMMPSVILKQYDERDWDHITHHTEIKGNVSKGVNTFVSVIPDNTIEEEDIIKGLRVVDNKINARSFLHFTSTNGVSTKTIDYKYITDITVCNNYFDQTTVIRELKDLGSSTFIGSSFITSVCPANIDNVRVFNNTVVNCTGPILALNYLVRGRIRDIQFYNNKVSGICGIPFVNNSLGKQKVDYQMVGYFIINGSGDKQCNNIVVRNNVFNYVNPTVNTFPVPLICNFCNQQALRFEKNVENNGFNKYLIGNCFGVESAKTENTSKNIRKKQFVINYSRKFNCKSHLFSDNREDKSIRNLILKKYKEYKGMCMFGNLLFWGDMRSNYNADQDGLSGKEMILL